MSPREKLLKRLEKNIKKQTGLTLEFINSHSIWELEEILGIGHYKIVHPYTYVTYPCGCRVRVPITTRSGHY